MLFNSNTMSIFIQNYNNIIKINNDTKILLISSKMSLKYYKDYSFRDKINEYKKEVHLDFTNNSTINDIDNLNLVSMLTMNNCCNIKNMNCVTNMTNLWKIHTLNIVLRQKI